MKRVLLTNIFLLIVSFAFLHCQNVYKTPSGKKYHLASCYFVENVSERITSKKMIQNNNLEACKFCKPPTVDNLDIIEKFPNDTEALGQENGNIQCIGITLEGKRCKRFTKIRGGYCFQHGPEQIRINMEKAKSHPNTFDSNTCGARTQNGHACKRKVNGGGHCYQHR